MIHGGVSWFRNIFLFVVWISLLICSAIYTLFNYSPSKIVIRKLSFLNWTSGWESCHYSCKWQKHIVEIPCMIDGRTLVGDLETTLAHSKMHGIHVNFSRKWLIISRFCHIGKFIFEDRDSDLNLLSSFLSNRFYQSGKPWMWINCLVKNELRAWCLVNFWEVIKILINKLFIFLIVQNDMIFGS